MHVVVLNNLWDVAYAVYYMRRDMQAGCPEELLSENARLRAHLQRMVHDMENLRSQLKKPDGPQSQSSVQQYAEDLEIQLEHVECLKGDLELQLTKAQAEIDQLKACMQVATLDICIMRDLTGSWSMRCHGIKKE